MLTTNTRKTGPANRFGLDYTMEAEALGPPITPIIDVHSHINGTDAAWLYKRTAKLYGISLTYSMTHLEQVETVREILGDRIRFIAVPDYRADDKRHAFGEGYIERLKAYREHGVRMAKFWAAPRATDYAIELGDPSYMNLDAPHRVDQMQAAHDLGMYFMTHIADPDTWFSTKYSDSSTYGTKEDQYEPFERLLDRFAQPWIAAHMGGWPENLTFLSALLDRHDNLYLDTSATKWMVRELSRHPRDEIVEFLRRYRGRILFGSDIVTIDDHLQPSEDATEMTAKASSPEDAFDLYASRYWALRHLWETDFDGESPIADPDLAMVNPERHTDFDAPMLRGKSLPDNLLRELYHDAAERLLEPLHSGTAQAH